METLRTSEAPADGAYEKFVQLLESVKSYQDQLVPGVKKVLAPFLATQPTQEEFFTLPNAMSLAGFLLVVDGARNITTREGVRNIAIGRGVDAIDGMAARALKQTSPFGAMTDVTLDKLGMAVIFAEAWKQNALPREILYSLAGNQTTSAFFTYVSEIGDVTEVDTTKKASRIGKYSMAAELTAIVGMLWEGAKQRDEGIEHPNLRNTPFYVPTLGAEALRWLSVAGYGKRFVQSIQAKRKNSSCL